MLIGLLAILSLGGCASLTVHPNSNGGGSCAGVSGRRCLPGEFCDLQPGQCHGFEIAGVCVPQPEVCTRDYRPVCGCNGTTYGNDCMRIAAGVQKARDGECGAAPCGGATGYPHHCADGKHPCPHEKHGCPHTKGDCPHEQSCPHERKG
jgi:hypothetical protein